MSHLRLVEYFVVCGVNADDLAKDTTSALSAHIPPLLRGYSPSLLSHYPHARDSAPLDEGAVMTLCLPAGLQFRKNLESPWKSFHSFLITRENGSHVYGSVLTFYEKVTDPRVTNTLECLQSTYCTSRKTIFNSDHADYLDGHEDELFAPKCVCLVSSRPIHRPLRAYLEQLFAVTVGDGTASLPTESYLFNLLYEVNLPPPGKYLKITGPLGKISWRMPPKTNFSLCDYSFRDFFEMLGICDVLQVLTCVLLEHQVLLKSADYHKLMLGANCLIALLFPFSWPHVFVPILPASQRGFLDAPVPYIMGLRVQVAGSNTKYLNIANESSLCSVDLDQHMLDLPDDLPELPNQERLISQLSEKVQEHAVNCPDIQELPSSPKSIPSKETLVEAIRIIKELQMQGSEQQVRLSQISEHQKCNPLLPNLLNMARRAGLSIAESDYLMADLAEGADDADEADSEKNEWNFSLDKKDVQFSSAAREVFSSYFVEHFANYENFVIMPQQTYDQWLRNREQFQNFDKAAFLSEQPKQFWPFYSAFLESNMFSAFIDGKVMSFWEPGKASDELVLFDSKVEAYREQSGLAKPPTTPGAIGITEVSSIFGDATLNYSDVINETAPLPHPLPGEKQSVVVAMRSKTRQPGCFPQLDSILLQPKSSTTKEEDPSVEANTSLPLSSSSRSRTLPRPSSANSTRSHSTDIHRIGGTPVMAKSIWSRRLRGGMVGSVVGGSSGSISRGFSSYSHVKFVNQLWRESRLRVKHMLGSSADSQSSVEENTHIAYLCDLLERIWGHGLKKRDSKSPLWAHLTAYAASEDSSEQLTAARPASPPSPPLLSSSMSSLAITNTATGAAEDSSRTAQSLRTQFHRRRFGSPLLRSQIEGILQPPPSSLLDDLLIVHNMRELKTDVGHARAWVRLSLEKKSLSRHLSALLANDRLSSKRYREYAFLRTEEEREQFLYHLLTLTAKEFSCFTTGFLSATMLYRVLVVAEGKHFGLSTSSLYLTLAGEYGSTGVVELPRGEYQIDITHHNLGPLTCLRVGHDNSGITPGIMVEMVMVNNITTGQIYRFYCGRWLSRSEDDGSIERFLTAEKVPQTVKNSCTMAALGVDSVLPSPRRKRRGGNRREPESSGIVSQLKSSLKSTVEKIRLVVQGKGRETPVQELLKLIHGENGYLKTMERILLFGFKSSRKFSKRLYLWDLVERVREQVSTEAPPPIISSPRPDPDLAEKQLFCSTVSRINSNSTQIGKDEKMALFLCVGLRDHHNSSWVQLLAECSAVTVPLYDPASFMRDSDLFFFLTSTLSSTSSLPIRLEPLLTQGM